MVQGEERKKGRGEEEKRRRGAEGRVRAKCRARDGRRNSRGRARPGCTAEAKIAGKVVQVRELNTAFRGTPCSLCFLRLVPNQRSNPKKCNPRLLRRQHIEGSENWAGARRREKKKKKGRRRAISK